MPQLWQAILFLAAKVAGPRNRNGSRGRGLQDADAPRLDLAKQRMGGLGDQTACRQPQIGPVIGDQHRPDGHQL